MMIIHFRHCTTSATCWASPNLYRDVYCAGILTEIINSRLFTTVRDTLGLTYDVSFELSLFDRLPNGWFVVNVTSTPQKINEALQVGNTALAQ